MSCIRNMFGFEPNYDEKLLGTVKICLVKDLPDNFKVKRAGCILYSEQNKIETKIIKKKKNSIQNEKIYQDTQLNINWKNRFNTFPGKNYHVKFLERHSDTPSSCIVLCKPELIDLCYKDEKDLYESIEVKTLYRKYCLGIDSTYGTLTDFGGKVRMFENSINASLRELKEESFSYFDFKKYDIENSIIVYNDEVSVIFIKTEIEPKKIAEDYNRLYLNAVSNKKKYEISRVEWLQEYDFKKILNVPYVVFEPIRGLLNNKIDQIIKMLSM